ncbi:MAG: HAD-IA family hydrolase [Gemmatimonadota bacterium]|nr:HAD-IA family hydrolase [Gemmatimonadota bacterium]MDQ8168093.1 HAD-IA family hydrolase [Gemmatimonadota bacterium]MDQ8172617.1 HAD-IA family hydrolase [Gemmatimonadota bacterium]
MNAPAAEVLRHAVGAAIDGVIFDCDGVLVDSERISNGTWALLLTEIGLPMTMEQSLSIFMGNSMARCVEIVTEMMGHAPPDDLLARFTANVTVALQRDLEPVAGIVALLDTLDAAGMRYGVASNGEHEKMRTTLGKTGLLARFEGKRFSAVDVGKPKPAPDLFLHAARTLGFDPTRTVVVEDSPLGVQGATAAGMAVIGFAEIVSSERLHAAGAVVTVDRLADVAALLGLR